MNVYNVLKRLMGDFKQFFVLNDLLLTVAITLLEFALLFKRNNEK